jgi:hypothetical protein
VTECKAIQAKDKLKIASSEDYWVPTGRMIVFLKERAQDSAYFIDIEEKYSRLTGTLRLARHLAPADSQREVSPFILATRVGTVDSARSKTRLFLSFQISHTTSSASERTTVRGVCGRELMASHHSIGSVEVGGEDGMRFGRPSQFAISVQTRRV